MRLLPLVALSVALCLPMAACKKGPDPAVAAANLSAGEAFLAKNKTQPGVVAPAMAGVAGSTARTITWPDGATTSLDLPASH